MACDNCNCKTEALTGPCVTQYDIRKDEPWQGATSGPAAECASPMAPSDGYKVTGPIPARSLRQLHEDIPAATERMKEPKWLLPQPAPAAASPWKCPTCGNFGLWCKCNQLVPADYVGGFVKLERTKVSDFKAVVPSSGEMRIVSATGGEKGQKQTQMGAVDPIALGIIGAVAGFGSGKYARYNFTKGYDWSLSYDAMQRHLMAWWTRQDNDPESGLSHLGHAAWHCLALMFFQRTGTGTDDRFP